MCNQGEKASEVFLSEIENETIKKVYGESAKFFADTIKNNLKPNKYTLVDVGAFKGELLSQILKFLPDYKFDTIGIDKNEEIINNNDTVKDKIISDLINIPLENDSVDVLISRYVLSWNNLEKQEIILKEFLRITNKIAIIQHAGSDNADPESWREKYDELFLGKDIPKLKREEMFFSSRDEIEEIMKRNKFNFERLSEIKIDNFSEVFIEKYNLQKEEKEKIKEILKEKDYMVQANWIIYK